MAAGLDAGWLDEVSLVTETGRPFTVEPEFVQAVVGQPITYASSFFGSPAEYSAEGLPPGLKIHPTTGIISGEASESGIYHAPILARDDSGGGELELTIRVIDTFNAALDVAGLTWETGGDQPWTFGADEGVDGGDAARTDSPGENGEAWLETTVEGPGTLTFSWRVSSEPDFDFLRLFLDGRQILRISGDSGWLEETVELEAGTHTLRWVYDKDLSEREGEDAAWLDDVSLSGYAGWVADALPGETSIWPPSEDPDKDGLANLLEYSLSLNPSEPSSLESSVNLLAVDGQIGLSLQRVRAIEELVFGIEYATSLADLDWTTEGIELITEPSGRVVGWLPSAPGGGRQAFLRLRVTFLSR